MMTLDDILAELKATETEPRDLNLDKLQRALKEEWKPARLRLGEGPVGNMPGLCVVLKKESVISEIPVSSGPGLVQLIEEERQVFSRLPIDVGQIEKGLELLKFATREELITIVQRLRRASGLACGIVRMPAEHQGVPHDESKLVEWRPTDIVGKTMFCTYIRDCSAGNLSCMWADLRHAREAASSGRAKVYRCSVISLSDVVAPIKIAASHVANIYLGQARDPHLEFDTVWKRYEELLAKSEYVPVRAERDQLRQAFDALPVRTEEQMERVAELLQCVSETLSRKLTRQAVLETFLQARRKIGATLSLNQGLQLLLEHALRLLPGNSGSVFLLDEKRHVLISHAMQWGGFAKQVKLKVWGAGIVPNVVSSGGALIHCRTRKEIEAYGPPQEPQSRDMRALESIVAIPIGHAGSLVGVLELGSPKRLAFSKQDIEIVRIFAEEMAIFIKTCQDQRELITLFGENRLENLATTLVKRIPLVVGGTTCSIFLQYPGEKVIRLFASSEFPEEAVGELTYEAGVGLTGWVLSTGRAIRIDGGPGCRTTNLPSVYTGAKWQGEHRSWDKTHPAAYYTSRPWLAVPIRGSDTNVIGVIRIADRHSGNFSAEDENFLLSCADCIARLWETRPHEQASHPHNNM